MGLVSKDNTFSAGETITAVSHNENYDTLYNLVNGNIDNANINASAGIVDSKLAQITTASKVSGAALTSLSSIPSGAGDIPSVNLDGNAVVLTGAQTVAGVKTFSSIPVLTSSDPTSDDEAARKAYVDGSAVVGIEDYGTSTGTGTVKNLSALKIVYGTTTSIAGNGTFVITSLPFTSASTYTVTVTTKSTATSSFIAANANNDSGSQCTITNHEDSSGTFYWQAIGT
jgi:hypothetical protein